MNRIERRLKERYQLALGVRFIAVAGGANARPAQLLIQGVGKTANISSSGILFRSGIKVPAGSSIRLEVEWPARPNERAISLIASGRVIRSRHPQVAVRVGHYDFARQMPPTSVLVIVADTAPVYSLVCSVASRNCPVLQTHVRDAIKFLKKYRDEPGLVIVTNQFREIAAVKSGAFVINTDHRDSDQDLELSPERIVHLRRPLNADRFRAVLESTLQMMIGPLSDGGNDGNETHPSA